MTRTVAALFVAKGDCYTDLPDVDPWTEDRDARLYAGPWPVVAHPPCERWGRYWGGGPSAKHKRTLGDDGGCFTCAITSVRLYGGVLEHPEASHAWRANGLLAPPKAGQWIWAGDGMGVTCCVEQGHYGHRARKATWLYAVGIKLPDLVWGPCAGKSRLDVGYHSADERKRGGRVAAERLTRAECIATPIAFRDVLLAMARSVT